MSTDNLSFWGEKTTPEPSTDFYDAWGASGNVAAPKPEIQILSKEQVAAYWVRNGQLTGSAEWKEDLRQLIARFPDVKLVQFNAIAGHIASTDEDGTEQYFDTVESTFAEYRVQNPLAVEVAEKYSAREAKEVQKYESDSRKQARLQFKQDYAIYLEACSARRARIKDAQLRRDARIAEVEAEFQLALNEPPPVPPTKTV